MVVGRDKGGRLVRAGDPDSPVSVFPERPHSVFDPTGLVPSACDHGLPEHPLGFPLMSGGQSFIRAKYMTWDMTCVVCRGDPVPDDLTTPRVAP